MTLTQRQGLSWSRGHTQEAKRRMRSWKIGELARATGLTVRTLHHYDSLGLLRPSERSPAGYRLYGAEDVVRLQKIVSLRRLGFSLDAIRDCLDTPGLSLGRVLEMHLASARELP